MPLLALLASIALLPSTTVALPHGPAAARPSVERILLAIRTVESGGTRDGGRSATGDGGRAIGPYQVHRLHWIDSRLPGRFEDCRDPEYAEREVLAYWQRWCPEALERRDVEVLARVHNGGPNGARKRATLAFWHRVQRTLEESTEALAPAGAVNPPAARALPRSPAPGSRSGSP